MTKTNRLEDVLDAVHAGQSFLVTSHALPDGDAIGSTLAMAGLLRALGKQNVYAANPDGAPRLYQWLPGTNGLLTKRDAKPAFDTLIIMDVAQRERLGPIAEWIDPQTRVIVIDHHLEQNPCGELNFIDPSYAAVGEICVDLFNAAQLPLSQDDAINAYVAQITDTGGFRFSNTNPRSHRIAAQLLETGIDVFDISQRIFEVLSHPKAELLRRVLERRKVADCGRAAYSQLGLTDMKEANAGDEDAEGLVNYLRNLEGVEMGILMREAAPDRTKVSARAKGPINAADFLKPFGGGGHKGAAGATIPLPLDTVKPMILDRLNALLENRA